MISKNVEFSYCVKTKVGAVRLLALAICVIAASCSGNTLLRSPLEIQRHQASLSTQLYMHGTGGHGKQSELFLNETFPTSKKYKSLDSGKLGGKDENPWRIIGEWNAIPGSVYGQVASENLVDLWIGQKHGNNRLSFDLRAELLRNDTTFAVGELHSISKLSHSPNKAKHVTIEAAGSVETFDGNADIFSLRILARRGDTGEDCREENGSLRLYFDSSSRASRCTLAVDEIPKEDWKMFGHDASHSRLSQFTGPQSNNLVWSVTAGDKVLCSPAINPDGIIYFGSFDKKLYAINPDGSTAWTYSTGGQVDSGPAILTDGGILVGSGDTFLYCLNADGTLRWKFDTDSYINASPVFDSFGTVYVGSADSTFYAINPDGTSAWSYPTGGPISSSAAIGPDGSIYVGSSDAKVYSFSSSGTLQWSYSTGSSIFSSPAVSSSGQIFIGSNDGKLYSINQDGTLNWASNIASGYGVSSSPALASDGTIYVGTVNGVLYALNPDGTAKWSFPTSIQMYSSPAIDSQGTIYVGSHDSHVYAVNPDGSLKWTFTTGERVFSSPAIGADGRLYIGSFDGNLYAFGS